MSDLASDPSTLEPPDSRGGGDIGARVCDHLRERLDADRVIVWAADETTGTVTAAIMSSRRPGGGSDAARKWRGTPLAAFPAMHEVLKERQAVVILDPAGDPRLPRGLASDLKAASLRLEPLTADRPVGAVSIEPCDRDPAQAQDLMLLLALSVSESAARRQADHHREQAQILLELTDAMGSTRSLSETLGEICARLARHTRMRRVSLFSLTDGLMRPTVSRSADGRDDAEALARLCPSAEGLPLIEQVLVTGEPQLAEDPRSPLISGSCAAALDISSALGIPLVAAGEAVGALLLDDPAPRAFPDELVRLVAAVGHHLSGMMAQVRADSERAWHLRTLAAVRDLLHTGSQKVSVCEAGEALARVAAEAFGATHALYAHKSFGGITALSTVGMDDATASAVMDVLLGTDLDEYSLWSDSLASRTPIFIDAGEDLRLPPQLVEAMGGLRASAALPVTVDEEPLGVVHLTGSGSSWTEEQRKLAEQLVLEARLVVDNALLREQEELRRAELAHRSTHDTLTGLPNRALLQDRLTQTYARAKRQNAQVALLFVDLDRFKRVNDTIGHASGDELLKEVAHRLTGCVRAEDTVARFAGDEFIVLLEPVDSVDEAERVADRIHLAMAEPILLAGSEIFVTASVGISCSKPADASPDLLLRSADAAMYRVKRGGRGRHAIYDPAADTMDDGALSLEADLHHALERDELSLRYQPILNLDDGTAVGFEALLRWEHPEHGTVAPLDFIPVAEANGLIAPIGRWVIDQSCRQIGRWRGEYPERDLFVSVNLSPLQVHDPGLVSHVRRALSDSGLAPAALVLELTESTLVHEEDGLPVLAELRRAGVRIAIDDFGTGYSALGYLQRFPIDVLKVDRSFVSALGRGPADGALARAVVAIARSLGLTSVAEGIEDVAQLAELRELGSHLGQGFHFAAPLTVDEATTWLEG